MNRENKESYLNSFSYNVYLGMFDYNKSFEKLFENLKKNKMNINELKSQVKVEEIQMKFEEIMNFYRNSYNLEYSSSNNLDKSVADSPRKKEKSKTLLKKSMIMSQLKVNEKKQRNSYNTSADGN